MSSRRRRAAARRLKHASGSPEIVGEPEFLLVGKLQHPHGLHGEMLMTVLTDFPERLQPGVAVYLGEEHRPLRLLSRRHHNKGLLIAFEEYTDREELFPLRNLPLFVRAADRPPLPEGEYYHHQLIGLRVETDEGEELGVLASILETGANDVYVVRRPNGPDLLLPAIDDVIQDIDLQNGVILVHLLEGLAR